MGLRGIPGKKPQWRFTKKNGKFVRDAKAGGIDWYRYVKSTQIYYHWYIQVLKTNPPTKTHILCKRVPQNAPWYSCSRRQRNSTRASSPSHCLSITRRWAPFMAWKFSWFERNRACVVLAQEEDYSTRCASESQGNGGSVAPSMEGSSAGEGAAVDCRYTRSYQGDYTIRWRKWIQGGRSGLQTQLGRAQGEGYALQARIQGRTSQLNSTPSSKVEIGATATSECSTDLGAGRLFLIT